MNNALINTKLKPTTAIIVHQNTHATEFYLESREILSGPNGLTFLEPKPMKEQVIRDIARAYAEKSGSSMKHEFIIGDHILHASSDIGKVLVIWYRPAMIRKLNFANHLKIKGECEVKVPATLYASHNRTLFVFALASNERPTAKTKLYNAPFFNIYEGGNICLGTAHVGTTAKTFEKEADRFEVGFYMAEQNGGDHKNSAKRPLPEIWNSLIKSKAQFPVNDLIQHKKYKTFGAFIDQFVAGGYDE